MKNSISETEISATVKIEVQYEARLFFVSKELLQLLRVYDNTSVDKDHILGRTSSSCSITVHFPYDLFRKVTDKKYSVGTSTEVA